MVQEFLYGCYGLDNDASLYGLFAWQMAGGCLKPGPLGQITGCLALDVCFGCLSVSVAFLRPAMRADFNIYLFSGVVHICTWVICGLLCVFVDCVFGSCGAPFARVIAALRRICVLERFGAFPRC